MEPRSSPASNSVRTTKRKLEDAIRTLDGVVIPTSLATAVDRPTPSKRPHITRSVFSSLAKFGATSKEPSRPSPDSPATLDISKCAPRLSAILARSAVQPKQSSTFSHPAPLVHPASEYRPSSTKSFLSRLATYKITTYSNKPAQIDAVAAARCGWINDGKDRLVCGMCDVSWVLASREGMNKDAASALVEKQHNYLVDMHKDGCPWKTRQCEPSIYRVPLQAPAVMVRDLKATALSLEPILANVAIKHPLSPSQMSSLRSIFEETSERRASEHNSTVDASRSDDPVTPSETAIAVALFGWVMPTSSEPCHTSSLLLSHASFGPSASRPQTPSLSRASSVSSHFRERASSPVPSASPRTSISHFNVSPDRVRISSRSPWHNNHSALAVSRDASLVYCVLCHRRIGLWGYSRHEATPLAQGDVSSASRERSRDFDLVKEHRSYCPYIVRSSVVPSFLLSPSMESDRDEMEGWRAVLTVVQRYELSQRQHLSRFLPKNDNQVASAELKGVESMVAGVKSNGGRELLKYVKGLLG